MSLTRSGTFGTIGWKNYVNYCIGFLEMAFFCWRDYGKRAKRKEKAL